MKTDHDRFLRDGPGTARVAILGVSVALRVSAALYLGDVIRGMPGIHDQISYDQVARQLVSGQGFTCGDGCWPATTAGSPTAHWSYLYTSYLALVYASVGHSPLAARLIQAVLAGVLQPWLTWRIGRRLFDERIGLVAAGVSAVYGYFVYYAAALMTETFFILAVLWVMDLATTIRSHCGSDADDTPCAAVAPSKGLRWALLGLALGTAVLLRQTVLLFVPFLFLWLLRAGGRRQWTVTAKGLFVTAAVVVLMVAPWTLRNYRAFDRFVLLNTSAGYAFYWANHPIHGTRFVPILPDDGPSYGDLIPEELVGLDEAGLERELMVRGLGFVREAPLRYLRLSVSRLEPYFKFWPSSESSTLSNVSRTASFGLFLPFILAGLCTVPFSAAGRRAIGRGAGLLYLFAAVYSIVHLLSWALIRYRLPVDAVLMPFAAVGLATVFDLISAARRKDGSIGSR